MYESNMCRLEDKNRNKIKARFVIGTMGLKKRLSEIRVDKFRNSMRSSSKMKMWLIRATTTVLLWTCVVQLTALGGTWGPRVLKGWPSCFSVDDHVAKSLDIPVPAKVLPPKSECLCFCCWLYDGL